MGSWSNQFGTGCGGVTRGDSGEWLKGFTAKFEGMISVFADVKAIEENREVESDAKLVIKAIEGRSDKRI